MKEWHFNVLFLVGVLGAVVMLFGPAIGIDWAKNPTAVTGVGVILTYVLAQKSTFTKTPPKEEKKSPEEKDNDV